MDFPALVARDLYREFGGEGARVLDPCHGWGGRLVGALLADVRHYCGIDPDPDTHRGVQLMADTFLDYCKETTVELIEAPFEDVVLDEGVYDMALTSPPYFDVEQYRGGGSRRTKNFRNTIYGWRASIVHLSQRHTGRCGPEDTSAFRWARSRTRSATTRCA